MKIKICGITRPADAEFAAAVGADAVGLNFSAMSRRQVGVEAAADIAAAVAGRLVRVGVFVDPTAAAVEAVLARVGLDLLQFHGDEDAGFCGAFSLPYMKVHRVREGFDFDRLESAYPDACCHLLDAYVPGQPGGTGKPFDWALWPADSKLKLMLAGGLTPDNVGDAIQHTRPYGVDVSGGVEGSVKGHKDTDRIRRFVSAARAAEPAPADQSGY